MQQSIRRRRASRSPCHSATVACCCRFGTTGSAEPIPAKDPDSWGCEIASKPWAARSRSTARPAAVRRSSSHSPSRSTRRVSEDTATSWRVPLGKGWRQEVGLVTAIILLGIYFTSRNGVFLSLDNLGNIAEQSTFIGLLAVAMTFVVVSGQFDLSV